MRLSSRAPKPSERARDAAEAAQEAALSSLSHTSTLIIQHDDSTTAAAATRQALLLHRTGRSRTIEVRKDGFSLVADGDGGHAPAVADARAGGSPNHPAHLSLTKPGRGGTEGRGNGSNGGDSNSPSESGDDCGRSSSRKEKELRSGQMQEGPAEPADKRRCGGGGRSVLLMSLSAAEARERADYAQQERGQTQARSLTPSPHPDPTRTWPGPLTPLTPLTPLQPPSTPTPPHTLQPLPPASTDAPSHATHPLTHHQQLSQAMEDEVTPPPLPARAPLTSSRPVGCLVTAGTRKAFLSCPTPVEVSHSKYSHGKSLVEVCRGVAAGSTSGVSVSLTHDLLPPPLTPPSPTPTPTATHPPPGLHGGGWAAGIAARRNAAPARAWLTERSPAGCQVLPSCGPRHRRARAVRRHLLRISP